MAIRLVRVYDDTIRALAGDAAVESVARLTAGEAYARVPFEVWRRYFGQEISIRAVVAHCAAAGELVPETAPRRRLSHALWPRQRGARWLAFIAYIWGTLAWVEQLDPWISRTTDWPALHPAPPLRSSLALLAVALLCLVAAWWLEWRRDSSTGRAA